MLHREGASQGAERGEEKEGATRELRGGRGAQGDFEAACFRARFFSMSARRASRDLSGWGIGSPGSTLEVGGTGLRQKWGKNMRGSWRLGQCVLRGSVLLTSSPQISLVFQLLRRVGKFAHPRLLSFGVSLADVDLVDGHAFVNIVLSSVAHVDASLKRSGGSSTQSR